MSFFPCKTLRVIRLQKSPLRRTLNYVSRILGVKIVIPKIVSLSNFEGVVKKALDVTLRPWRAEYYRR